MLTSSRWSGRGYRYASIGMLLIASVSQAAVVTWQSDADGTWTNGVNWSSSPMLPGSGDAVVIDRPSANPVISASNTTITIQTIDCTETLNFSSGVQLNLTGGPSVISGAFTLTNGVLSVAGAGTSLQLSGTANLNGSRMGASGGGTIALPVTLTTYSQGSSGNIFSADRAGSVLDASSLKTLSVGVLNGTATIKATNGGIVDLSGLETLTNGGNHNNYITVLSLSDGSGGQIKLPNLKTVASAVGQNITYSPAATGALPSLQSTDSFRLTLNPGVHYDLPVLTTFNRSTLSLNGGSATIPALTNIDGSRFKVFAGSTLALPATATAYALGADDNIFSADGTGSFLDASSLKTLSATAHGWVRIKASNSGIVDLSNLETITNAGTHNNYITNLHIEETTGGKILFDSLRSIGSVKHWVYYNPASGTLPSLETLGKVQLFVPAGVTVNMPVVTTVGSCVVDVYSGGSLTMPKVSDLSGSTIKVSGGSHLILPELFRTDTTSFILNSGYVTMGWKVPGSPSAVDSTIGIMPALLGVDPIAIHSLQINGNGVAVLSPDTPDQLGIGTLTIQGESGATLEMSNDLIHFSGMTLGRSQALVAMGYNGGNWQGAGIRSSIAAANPELFSLAAHGDLSANVFVKLVYRGDADVDGMVSVGDLGILATNWSHTVIPGTNGDFNFDGVVNVGDLGILASAWGRGTGLVPSPTFEAALGAFPELTGAAVPETASIGLLGMSSVLLLRRRRR